MSFLCRYNKKSRTNNNDKIEKVIKYWDYEKNVGLDPTKIYKNSNLEVYWKCENGHSWKSKIKTKSDSGALGCIYCDRKTPIITKEKELLRYWDFEKNQELDPHYMTCASNKEVYWKCKKDILGVCHQIICGMEEKFIVQYVKRILFQKNTI